MRTLPNLSELALRLIETFQGRSLGVQALYVLANVSEDEARDTVATLLDRGILIENPDRTLRVRDFSILR